MTKRKRQCSQKAFCDRLQNSRLFRDPDDGTIRDQGKHPNSTEESGKRELRNESRAGNDEGSGGGKKPTWGGRSGVRKKGVLIQPAEPEKNENQDPKILMGDIISPPRIK